MPGFGEDFDDWDKSFLWEFESQSIDNFNGWILNIDGFINFEKFSQSMGFFQLQRVIQIDAKNLGVKVSDEEGELKASFV